MIDLTEVEKERLLDEVSFLQVLFYLLSTGYFLPHPILKTQHLPLKYENLSLFVIAK